MERTHQPKQPRKRQFTVFVVAGALLLGLGPIAACIGPDLEPPGASATSAPGTPNAPKSDGGSLATTPSGGSNEASEKPSSSSAGASATDTKSSGPTSGQVADAGVPSEDAGTP